MFVLISLVLVLASCVNAGYECSDEYSCINNTIVNTDGDIDCLGLASCAKSFIDNFAYIDDGRTTACWGARSCQSASVFDGDVTYPADLRGYLALAWTKISVTTGSGCMGEASCYQIENATNENVYCRGFRSCDGLIGINNDIVRGFGTLSLANSILFDPSNVYLYSFYSGYNSTIYCQYGKSCSIYCYVNGCENLNVICENGADCRISCDEEQGVTCPTNYSNSNDISNYNYNSSNSEYYSILTMISNVFNNSDYILNNDNDNNVYVENIYKSECNSNSSDIHCGNANDAECNGVSWTNTIINNICCTGHRACTSSTIGSMDDDCSNYNNVYCDSNEGCFGSNIYGVLGIGNI